jgi:phosphate transport system protein
MAIRLQKELEKLKKRILSLGAMVEERVHMAIQAVHTRDANLARKIVEMDSEIDENEVEVEEECLKLLALHQPVAVDLRFITAVIKINNDLERIGDQAVNIAQRIEYIARKPQAKVPFDYASMAEKTVSMLKQSLDALVNLDSDLAQKVRLKDDEVDDETRVIYDKIKKAVRSQPQLVGYMVNFFLVSRHLERIADLATNIAEEVIYMVDGEISRHRKNASNPDDDLTTS